MNITAVLNVGVIASAIAIMAYGTQADAKGPSTDITPVEVELVEDSAWMKVGQRLSLTAKFHSDSNASLRLLWYSDNTAVATVENGIVTAVGPGTAIITSGSGASADMCTVTVTE